MLDVRRLALLREVEARGSIAAVSRAQQVSSSAVSQQLAKLEAEVGVRLLEQSGRTVQVTEAGRRLAEQAGRIVTLLEEAEADLERRRGHVQGVVRVAAFSTFALRYLPELVARMAGRHPDVVVEFTHADPEQALQTVTGRHADVAVIDEYESVPHQIDVSMARTHLLREAIRAWAPRPLRVFDELRSMPWVFEPAGSDAARWATRTCRLAGFEPQVRFESPDLRVHQSLAVAGLAAAFLPEMLFNAPGGPLQRPPHPVQWPAVSDSALHRDVYAVVRRGAQNGPAVSAMLAFLCGATSPDDESPTRDARR